MKTLIKVLIVSLIAGHAVAGEKIVAQCECSGDVGSTFYRFCYGGGSGTRYRDVWNEGTGGIPEVIDYILKGDTILVKVMSGRKEDLDRLIQGEDAPLTAKKTLSIEHQSRKSDKGATVPADVAAEEKHYLFELICLMEQLRHHNTHPEPGAVGPPPKTPTPNTSVEATATSPAVDSESTPPPPHL
jgi:hypothetical protein